jgi:hypothetical protein
MPDVQIGRMLVCLVALCLNDQTLGLVQSLGY